MILSEFPTGAGPHLSHHCNSSGHTLFSHMQQSHLVGLPTSVTSLQLHTPSAENVCLFPKAVQGTLCHTSSSTAIHSQSKWISFSSSCSVHSLSPYSTTATLAMHNELSITLVISDIFLWVTESIPQQVHEPAEICVLLRVTAVHTK